MRAIFGLLILSLYFSPSEFVYGAADKKESDKDKDKKKDKKSNNQGKSPLGRKLPLNTSKTKLKNLLIAFHCKEVAYKKLPAETGSCDLPENSDGIPDNLVPKAKQLSSIHGQIKEVKLNRDANLGRSRKQLALCKQIVSDYLDGELFKDKCFTGRMPKELEKERDELNERMKALYGNGASGTNESTKSSPRANNSQSGQVNEEAEILRDRIKFLKKRFKHRTNCLRVRNQFVRKTGHKKIYHTYFMNRTNALELRIHNLSAQTCKVLNNEETNTDSITVVSTDTSTDVVLTDTDTDTDIVLDPPVPSDTETSTSTDTNTGIIIESKQSYEEKLDEEAGTMPIY